MSGLLKLSVLSDKQQNNLIWSVLSRILLRHLLTPSLPDRADTVTKAQNDSGGKKKKNTNQFLFPVFSIKNIRKYFLTFAFVISPKETFLVGRLCFCTTA